MSKSVIKIKLDNKKKDIVFYILISPWLKSIPYLIFHFVCLTFSRCKLNKNCRVYKILQYILILSLFWNYFADMGPNFFPTLLSLLFIHLSIYSLIDFIVNLPLSSALHPFHRLPSRHLPTMKGLYDPTLTIPNEECEVCTECLVHPYWGEG